MTEKIITSLRESKKARWTALAVVAFTMFCGYFIQDVLSPIKRMLETDLNWTSTDFAIFRFSYGWLTVFAFMLIIGGIILDKLGVRITGILATLIMVLGTATMYLALISQSLAAENWHILFWDMKAQVFIVSIGFSIFCLGVEIAGITVSKVIVKWFKGKELALAMGLEMATARLGVFAVFRLSPIFAEKGGAVNSVAWGVAFLTVGLLLFLIYTLMDLRLDKQLGEEKELGHEEAFKISDLWLILKNPGFLAIAGLCVLFYSAIFPFQKFATDMLASKLDISIKDAAAIFSYFPIGAMILTPFIGAFLDNKGYGATMMFYGAILLTVSHLIFAFVPESMFNHAIAYSTIVILGLAFSLVPASMWPSIPKIVEERFLGSAYGLTFWIQNIGLLAVPILIGWALSASNPGVSEQISAGIEGAKYNYFVPELIFAGFGVAAMILSLVLKSVDKKKGFGLDLPNKQ